MAKGLPNKRYTAELKQHVIETMREEGLSYSETARTFEVNGIAESRNGSGFI